jgi:uncharacterized membrane protein YoaK (UPF0700 family)
MPAMADPPTRTLLTLTFVTGIVDAVSFLGLGQVFAAMQTGNVIFLGFGVAGTAGASLVAPLVGLGAFIAGGCVAAAMSKPGASWRKPGLGAAMVIEVALLGSAAILAMAIDVRPEAASAYTLVALLSLAMGLRNTMARRVGGQNLATTVLNLTLTAGAPQAQPGIASGSDLADRGGAIVAILAGAATGALLLKTSLVLPIVVAAAITLAAGLTALRPQQRSEAAPRQS